MVTSTSAASESALSGINKSGDGTVDNAGNESRSNDATPGVVGKAGDTVTANATATATATAIAAAVTGRAAEAPPSSTPAATATAAVAGTATTPSIPQVFTGRPEGVLPLGVREDTTNHASLFIGDLSPEVSETR